MIRILGFWGLFWVPLFMESPISFRGLFKIHDTIAILGQHGTIILAAIETPTVEPLAYHPGPSVSKGHSSYESRSTCLVSPKDLQ